MNFLGNSTRKEYIQNSKTKLSYLSKFKRLNNCNLLLVVLLFKKKKKKSNDLFGQFDKGRVYSKFQNKIELDRIGSSRIIGLFIWDCIYFLKFGFGLVLKVWDFWGLVIGALPRQQDFVCCGLEDERTQRRKARERIDQLWHYLRAC